MRVITFHDPNEENGYLSNWYLSDFEVRGVKYTSMEQYMMHQKAVVFGNAEIVRRHIVGDANRTLISVNLPPRLCRIGTCSIISAE